MLYLCLHWWSFWSFENQALAPQPSDWCPINCSLSKRLVVTASNQAIACSSSWPARLFSTAEVHPPLYIYPPSLSLSLFFPRKTLYLSISLHLSLSCYTHIYIRLYIYLSIYIHPHEHIYTSPLSLSLYFVKKKNEQKKIEEEGQKKEEEEEAEYIHIYTLSLYIFSLSLTRWVLKLTQYPYLCILHV